MQKQKTRKENRKTESIGNETVRKDNFMNNVIIIIISQIFIKIIGIAYRIYLTNRDGFGDEGNAIYTGGYQIYSLLLLLSTVGIPSAISKLVSEKLAVKDYHGAHRTFKVSFVLVSMIGLAGSIILFVLADYISNKMLLMPEAALTIKFLAPSIFFVSMSATIRGYFLGMQTTKPTANSQTLEQVLKTILTVVFVEITAHITSTNTALMAASANLATTASVILSFTYIYRLYSVKKKGIWKEINKQEKCTLESKKSIIKKVLLVAIPISLTSIVVSINKCIDTVTIMQGLTHFLTEEEAKIQYGILNGKVDTLIGLPLAFNGAFALALIPMLSSAKVQKNMDEINSKISLSILISTLIALPASVGMCVFAQPILDLVFPNANQGANILSAISFMVVFTTIGQTLNGALQGLGKLKLPVISLIIGIVVKTILNLVLIPIEGIGIYGATTSSIICYVITFLIEIVALIKMTKIKMPISKFVVKPIVASGIMIAISYIVFKLACMIMSSNLSLILAIIVAVLVYCIAVVMLKILNKEEWLMMPKGEKIYNKLYKKTETM